MDMLRLMAEQLTRANTTPVLLPSRPWFPCLSNGGENLPHGVVVTVKGDLEQTLPSTQQFTFLPFVEHHCRKEPAILAPTGTSSQHCLVKATPPPLPPFLPHPVLSSWLLPRRPQGSHASHLTTGVWDWLSGTPFPFPSNSIPCVGGLLQAPSLGVRPHSRCVVLC